MLDNYTEPEELLSDESFLSWYFNRGMKGDSVWEDWMAGHPDRVALVEQAVVLLKDMVRPEEPLIPGQLQMAKTKLLNRIDEFAVKPASAPVTSVPLKMPVYPKRFGWPLAAAACFFLIAGAWWITARIGRKQEWQTSYGQIGQRELADGTIVTLNANSQLRYANNWKEGADREVWVDGEAFFHVKRTPKKSRFIVHTGHFDIIVTGTRFNVVNRPDADNVLLKEGSVIISCCDGKEMKMVPGDFVSYGEEQLHRGIVQPDSLMAWQKQQLFFEKTTLKDVITFIRNQYGVPVELGDSSIRDSTITAMMESNNLDVLLKALNNTSEYEVVREPGHIVIKARPSSK